MSTSRLSVNCSVPLAIRHDPDAGLPLQPAVLAVKDFGWRVIGVGAAITVLCALSIGADAPLQQPESYAKYLRTDGEHGAAVLDPEASSTLTRSSNKRIQK